MEQQESHEQDLRLVRSALAGDRRARVELGSRLVAACRLIHARNRRLGSPLGRDELLDLVQEVQLTVWRRLDTFEGRAALRTWIFRFCHLGMLKFLERRQRHAQRMQLLSNQDLLQADAPGPAAGISESESFGRLLRHLSPREAEVTRMRYLEQLGFEEVAEVLGISVSSAKTHCYRALDKLRDVVVSRQQGGAS